MKKTLISAALMTVVAMPALAGSPHRQGGTSYDYATVLNASPIYKTVQISTPREECWNEQVVYRDTRDGNSAVGSVLGGVVGGALGNAVGHKKSNKRVGAVVGAVVGATLGNAIAKNGRRDEPRYGTEERCKVYRDAYSEERLMGYDVRYRYLDQVYSTRMDRDPGDSIKVRIAVSPVI